MPGKRPHATEDRTEDMSPGIHGKYYRYSTKSTSPRVTVAEDDSYEADEDGPQRRTSIGDEELAGLPATTQKEKALFGKVVEQHPDAESQMRALFPESIPTTMNPASQSQATKAIRKAEEHSNKQCATAVVVIFLAVALIMLLGFAIHGSSGKEDDHVTGNDDTEFNGGGTPVGPEPRKPLRTAIKYNVSYGDAIYRANNHRTVCVYQARSENLVSMGSEYGVALFPFPYCHLVLYCCLTVTQGYAIAPQPGQSLEVYDFTILSESNPLLAPYAIVGGQSEDSMWFQELLDDPTARKGFIEGAREWCQKNEFRGLYLYWKDPEPGDRDKLTAMIRDMSLGLADTGHRLGVVVAQDPFRYPAFNVHELAVILGNDSILFVPRDYSASDYSPYPFAYYINETIDAMTSLLLQNETVDLNGSAICFLLPTAVLTFQLANSGGPVPSNTSLSLGPGPEGPIMNQAGKLSVTELCTVSQVNCTRAASPYGMEDLCEDVCVTYPTLQGIRQFMCDLQQSAGIHCFGLWDSDWDDFAGQCGAGDFPFVRTIFQRSLQPCDFKMSNSSRNSSYGQFS